MRQLLVKRTQRTLQLWAQNQEKCSCAVRKQYQAEDKFSSSEIRNYDIGFQQSLLVCALYSWVPEFSLFSCFEAEFHLNGAERRRYWDLVPLLACSGCTDLHICRSSSNCRQDCVSNPTDWASACVSQAASQICSHHLPYQIPQPAMPCTYYFY